MATNKESTARTFLVVFVLCLVCSIFVAGITVSLLGIQDKAKALDKQENIVRVSGLKFIEGKDSAADIYQKSIDSKFVSLKDKKVLSKSETEELLKNQKVKKVFDFDYVSASKAGNYSHKIGNDVAGIRFRSDVMPVFVARSNGKVVSYILPFYGQGLWSTLYGYLAVTPDGTKVVGINFYEHGETPGLGGEISNPVWDAKWQGKDLYNGSAILHVVKGDASKSTEIDGISGATLTGNGVTNCLAYWLSDDAYGPILKNPSILTALGGE